MTEELIRKNIQYPITVIYSEEDECYIAAAHDLPGCKAHGDTREEAAREIEIVIDLWLEIAVEQGNEIPEPSRN